MRNLSPALAAAVATLGSEPDIMLELADIQPHWQTVLGSAAPGKCDAAIAPDGSVVFAAVSGSGPWGLEVRRSTLPWTSWPDFVSVSGDANALAGVCVAVAGSTCGCSGSRRRVRRCYMRIAWMME